MLKTVRSDLHRYCKSAFPEQIDVSGCYSIVSSLRNNIHQIFILEHQSMQHESVQAEDRTHLGGKHRCSCLSAAIAVIIRLFGCLA
jgi:hypothetical protein